MTQQQFSTQAIHAGEQEDTFNSAIAPLYDTTTFSFDSTEELLEVVEGNKAAPLYTRYGMNPTITSLEQRLAVLDAAPAALAYASGMAAISSLCLAFGRGGIVCLGDVYGGTSAFLSQQAALLGIATCFVSAADWASLEQALQQGASLLVMETPANPTLTVTDIARVTELAHAYQVKVAVDNTFATPINQQPLAFNADFAVQSATKYLGGHSDLTAGVISADVADIAVLNEWRKSLGQTISAEIAHKLKRSLMTLPLRVERHNHNAMQVAQFLAAHPLIEKVHYPGLKQHAGYTLASQQMRGFGGMLSFVVKGDEKQARQLVDKLKLIKLAPSLGGAETLVTQPVTTSHHGLSAAELKRAGISGSMVRLSVGLESIEDIISDLDAALSTLAVRAL